MATHGWRSGRTLKEQLLEESSGFNYFQLIHLLKRAGSHRNNNESNSRIDQEKTAPILSEGSSINWRIGADLDAAFLASEISDVHLRSNTEVRKNLSRGFSRSLAHKISIKETDGQDSQALIAKTANYCIAGHLGPLPESYTSWIRDLQRDGNHALADFLDLFNHRINVLRYETKRDSCLALDHRNPEDNILAPGISAAMGMLGKGLFEQLPLSKRSVMALSGLVASRRISARSIQRVLSACFGLKTKVTDVIGVWRDTAPDQIWKLGQSGVSNLGELCILGQKNMDMQGKIRVEIVSVDIDKYIALLPDMHFSNKHINVPIRTDDDLLVCEYQGQTVDFQYQSEISDGSENSTDNQKRAYNSRLVENVFLKYDQNRVREKVMSPSHIEVIGISKSGVEKLRATSFSGYLHRPFVSLLRYLTNSKVDIEVVMEVDSSSLKSKDFGLITPSEPEGARLRLGESFWLGIPSGETEQSENQKFGKSVFTINGFDDSFSSNIYQEA